MEASDMTVRHSRNSCTDSANLLHAFFLGHPIVKEHTGDGVAQSITKCVKIYDINRSQYLGGLFDGAYFHLNVPEKLDNYFGFKGNDMKHHDWDPLHKAGLQDSHIWKDSKFQWKDSKFQWPVSSTKTIGEVFKIVNYGKEFEHLFDVAMEMKESEEAEIVFQTPKFFSEKRFANHARKVYGKATQASNLSNKIVNKRFAVILSGLCDIYEVFGHGVNILQTVDMLPHDKFSAWTSKISNSRRNSSLLV